MKIFFTSFLQVFFVAANTNMIAQKNYAGIIICSFLVSWFWTINVKNISISTKKQRLLYSFGAMIGCITGVVASSLIAALAAKAGGQKNI
jgi:hypothetical protein